MFLGPDLPFPCKCRQLGEELLNPLGFDILELKIPLTPTWHETSSSIAVKVIKFIVKVIQTKKTPDPESLAGEFHPLNSQGRNQ